MYGPRPVGLGFTAILLAMIFIGVAYVSSNDLWDSLWGTPEVEAAPAEQDEAIKQLTIDLSKLAPEVPAVNIYEEHRNMIVKLKMLDRRGHGSGVVVDANRGLILTNAHVTSGQVEMTVEYHGGMTATGRVMWRNALQDLSMVQVIAGALPTTQAEIRYEPLVLGEEVFSIGNPFHLEWFVARGYVAGDTEDGRILTDLTIGPGNSGGGLFDKDGRLVGFTQAIITVGSPFGIPPSGLSISVPISHLCDNILCGE